MKIRSKKAREFYIGWAPKAADSFRPFVRLLIFALVVTACLIASLLVYNQKEFSKGVFERNEMTELEGMIFTDPVPTIKSFYGKDIYGNPVVKTILLLNKGKFGADSLLAEIGREQDVQWPQAWVRLRGKLIYNKGVVLIETTEQEKAFLQISEITKEQKGKILIPFNEEMDSVSLQGEIIDPKCYFGVMNPAHGKPHSDCAIRCISGGIPPIFVIRSLKGEETFFILRGTNGEAINQQVLNYVGMPVSISGKLMRIDDWMVLKADPETITVSE